VEESISEKPEEISQQPHETQNNGIQHKPVDIAPKLPSYLDNLPYAEGELIFLRILSNLFLFSVFNNY